MSRDGTSAAISEKAAATIARQDAVLAAGPPNKYEKYASGKLNVAGVIFTADVQKKDFKPSSVFMAVRTADHAGPDWFGVIRKVMRIPSLAVSTGGNVEYDDVVYADWFGQVGEDTDTSRHKVLQVPMVKVAFDNKQAKLWRADMIVPVHLAVVPDLKKPKDWSLILSRDAKLWELAEPSWGPNPKSATATDKFRVISRGVYVAS